MLYCCLLLLLLLQITYTDFFLSFSFRCVVLFCFVLLCVCVCVCFLIYRCLFIGFLPFFPQRSPHPLSLYYFLLSLFFFCSFLQNVFSLIRTLAELLVSEWALESFTRTPTWLCSLLPSRPTVSAPLSYMPLSFTNIHRRCTDSAVWLLDDLTPRETASVSVHVFSVHHTTLHQLTDSLYWKPHT